jgi:PKD repeat protein
VEPGLHDVGFISVDTPDDWITVGPHEICGTVENFGDFDEFDVPVNAKVFYLGEGLAPSDLPFMEDFETASTAWSDWTVVETPANGDTWVRSTDYGFVDDGGATGYAAVMDDDGYGSGSDNPREELISPIISCSGETGVMLDFNGDFEDMAGDGIFWVNVSNDAGSTWTNVLFQTTDLDPGGSGTGFDLDPRLPLDISAIADGETEVQIKFTYSDQDDNTGNSGWAWGVMVDDIHVFSTPITGQGLTKDDPFAGKDMILIYESNAFVDVPEGGTAQVCFTPDALFGENGYYLINLTTMLPTDQFPDNDTAIKTLRAVVPCVQNLGPGPLKGFWFTTIQEAVTLASSGDTLGVRVTCNPYVENVEIEDKDLQIIKHPLDNVNFPDIQPLLCGNISGNQGIGFYISGDCQVNISDFEITDCTFGVYFFNMTNGSVTNCTIHGNGVGIGLETHRVGTVGINYNHFYSNGCGVVNYPAPALLSYTKDKDVILDEHFEGTWALDPDGDYYAPVDATYGNWDIDGLCVSYQSGYPQLTHYIAQMEDYGGYGLPYDGTYCAGAWWSDGNGGDNAQDEWLKTPVMDLSGGSNLELSFYGIWNWASTWADHVYIKASTDGGATWTIIADLLNDAQYEQGAGGPAGYGWCWNEYQVVIDVSAYASAQTQFAYQLLGDPTMAAINYIDAFLLTGDLGPTYTLTVNTIGDGIVVLTPPGPTYPENTIVDLEAIAAGGWKFIEWQGDLTGSNNPTTILMDSNKTVTAVFEPGIEGVPSEDGIHYNWFGKCKPPWDPGCISPGCAINNMDNYTILQAQHNWYEAPDGPSGDIVDPYTGAIADGLGNMIYGLIGFDPWMGINAAFKLDQGGVELVPHGYHGWLEAEADQPIFFDASDSFGSKFFWMFETADIPLQYYWSFGDQFFSIEESTTHTYASAGTYEGYLRVSANDFDVWPNTMFDWCTFTIYIAEPNSPLAANADGGGLGQYETIVKEAVQLYGQATGGTSPYTYYWSFGDGTPEVIGQSPKHTYMAEGTYTATLIVQDASGQTARDDATVYVAGIDELVANAGGPYEGAPDEAIYIRGSAFGGVEPYTYYWDFGDGSSANGASTVHMYEQEGTYMVTLTVTDSEGTIDDHTATVTIVEDHTDAQIKDIKGGLGIKATIVAGDVPVDWSVTVNGKYIFMGGEASGSIDANAIETIRTPFTIAIGNCDVTINAGTTTEQIEVLMIGPFAILK